jgi:hypothetical protein
VRRVSLETLIENPLTSMTLVLASAKCPRPEVRVTDDHHHQRTRNSQRVPDREEPGKPRKDARRGHCHPLETGFRPLWMTQLPRPYAALSTKQAQAVGISYKHPGVASSCRRIFCGAPVVPCVELAALWRVARRQALEQGGACAAAAAG